MNEPNPPRMPSKPFKIILGVMIIVVSGVAIAVVRLDNNRLRKRIVEARTQEKQVVRLRDENRQTRELVTRVQADASDGARAIHDDVVRARAEVQELERKATAGYAQLQAQTAQDAANLANNRDPEKGLTRLEHFQNRGHATPAAAFQTFVWAALEGADDRLAAMIAFNGEARAEAEEMMRALPEGVRAKYPTPEKLAALFFAAMFTAQPSAQIAGVVQQDAQHAVVTVRGLTDKAQKIPMTLEGQNWQVAVPPGFATTLGRWARGGGAKARE